MRGFLIAGAVCAATPLLAESHGGWTLEGFRTPESAYWEAGSGQIVVSNIGVFGPDGGMDGGLSLVSPEGEMIEADWVTGLMDPKGMASANGKLYVADATGLHVINVASGTVEATVALEGAMFPNDVAIGPDGSVYVTDMMGGGVYRVMEGTAEVFVPAGSLSLPNGIWAAEDGLIVGSMGESFSMENGVSGRGALFKVGYDGGAPAIVPGGEETGAIDGVVVVGNKIIWSDNPTGELVALVEGAQEVLATTEAGAADIGVKDGMLLVPLMQAGKLTVVPVD
ncbi:SMP-30/gluconolactonase/LRE family protein [Maritimibacter sp. DP1N21-5]|uniref:SMP-30/gluconolactonase/LRE family protein n=1 Tax=Maritimibacter sp. DP1N21-5 TaxID=2836867 RepID=UPI001C45CA46|nr:SMP-30/gluconolactonase/LRE family protein [Maritimibacter sp. DP1N21-5]MBV7410111.1 SMP-30/gluconolactonase/LRE family protein [Maritimibacter sp. DP1N21-5]